MGKLLIIGSTGFLGGALKTSLPREKFEIYCADRDTQDLSGPDFESLNLKNIYKIMSEIEFEAVIVCNWDGVSKLSRNDSIKQNANIPRVEEYLKLAITARIPTFIALGSQAEAEGLLEPVPESVIFSGRTAYAQAKSNLSTLLLRKAEDTSTRLVWARVFSVYGPGDHDDSLVSLCISYFKRNSMYRIRHPELLWSFLYITDFAKAIETLLLNSEINGVVNVANPNLCKLEEINKILFRVNHELMLETQDEENYMSPQPLVPILGKLSDAGWKPTTSLRQGILRILSS